MPYCLPYPFYELTARLDYDPETQSLLTPNYGMQVTAYSVRCAPAARCA
jgi:hypothetical protein